MIMTKEELNFKVSELEKIIIKITGKADVETGMLSILIKYLDEGKEVIETRRFILGIFTRYIWSIIPNAPYDIVNSAIMDELLIRVFKSSDTKRGYISRDYPKITFEIRKRNPKIIQMKDEFIEYVEKNNSIENKSKFFILSQIKASYYGDNMSFNKHKRYYLNNILKYPDITDYYSDVIMKLAFNELLEKYGYKNFNGTNEMIIHALECVYGNLLETVLYSVKESSDLPDLLNEKLFITIYTWHMLEKKYGINYYALKNINSLIPSNNDILNDEENIEYGEGVALYKIHKHIERSPRLIKHCKSLFIKKHGKLFCQACEIDYTKLLGKQAENVIECHHTKLVSKMKCGDKTRIRDMIMLCPICHSIAHKNSALELDELKQLVKKDFNPLLTLQEILITE